MGALRGVIFGGMVVSGMLAVVLADPPAAEEAPPPSTAPTTAPVSFAPMAYFNDRCGGCHGNYGSFWGEGFSAHLDDKALAETVREMAEGPAQAPLEDQALAALVAYHRSLVDGLPFVIVTERQGATLRGEVTPGSQVVIELGDRTVDATVQEHTWSVTLDPPPADNADGTIVATRDGRTTRLPWRQWHSHAQGKTDQPTAAH